MQHNIPRHVFDRTRAGLAGMATEDLTRFHGHVRACRADPRKAAILHDGMVRKFGNVVADNMPVLLQFIDTTAAGILATRDSARRHG